nr:unnamed protein product [Callosobruchus chinensis]
MALLCDGWNQTVYTSVQNKSEHLDPSVNTEDFYSRKKSRLTCTQSVHSGAIRLIGDQALTCHLKLLSQWRAVGDLSLFYRYSKGFFSSELTSIIPPLSKPARCTRKTFSSHPRAVVFHTSRTLRYVRTFVPRVSRAWNKPSGDVLIKLPLT